MKVPPTPLSLVCLASCLYLASASLAQEPAPQAVQTPAPAPDFKQTVAEPVPLTPEPIQSPAPVVPPSSSLVNEFQGEEIGSVLRLLARQAKVNIVVSEKVTGNVTMRLENTTPLEAIQVIVISKNLILDQINGVYYVKTQEEKAKEPTQSASYTFSYGSAEKATPLLATQLQGGVPPQFDARTNTIYYREIKSNLDNIRLFLESLDRPTQQVMIEARLVEVNANPKQSYGINWEGTLSDKTITLAGSGLSVSPESAQTVPFAKYGDGSFVGKLSRGGLNELAGQYAILSAPQLSVTLNLINKDDNAEFLANPRIVTANNQKATIKITRTQPVPQLNFNEQTATAVFGGFQDKEFGNTLEVTPTITKDRFINLLVKPEISNKVGDETFTFADAKVASPIIDKRALESNVLIGSGKTLAIGGLLQDETSKVRTKVPVLGDIPIVGYLFQSRANEKVKRNLLIFVTPTIITGSGTGLEDQAEGLKNSHEEVADSNGWRNNANGAVRLVPTSDRQLAAEYPVSATPTPKPTARPKPVARGYR